LRKSICCDFTAGSLSAKLKLILPIICAKLNTGRVGHLVAPKTSLNTRPRNDRVNYAIMQEKAYK